jgi:predicted aspartyl protease
MWRSTSAAALTVLALALGIAAAVAAQVSPNVLAADPPVPNPSRGASNTGVAATAGKEIPEATYAIPTRRDRVGRIMIPVRVNGRGPFQFVLDTGANTTVLAPQLAEALGLKVDLDQLVTMSGVTGSLPVPTAEVERVEAGAIRLEKRRLAVAQASLVGTDGVLGVDGLEDKLVLADFAHDRIEVLDARRHRSAPGLRRIQARTRFGRLLVIDVWIGRNKVKAVIDTGGQRTLGNSALYAKLGLHPSMTDHQAAQVVGATDMWQFGERYVVPQITLTYNLDITDLAVVFGDFYIFKLWDLERTPALVIGMDMIGTLDVFAVDYLRSEVQIKAGRDWSQRRGRW